jgi:hypothetical protein
MPSMDFANFSDASMVVVEVAARISTVVDATAIVLTHMRGIAFTRMTIIGTFYSFYLTIFSNSASISLSYAFFSMINFNISSLWSSVSAISFACGYFVEYIFSCFLKEAM